MNFEAILRDYKALRAKGVELTGKLVKSLSREDMDTAARKLGLLRGNTFVFETEDESCVLMDYAIHDIRHDGKNAVDHLLTIMSPVEGSLEYRLLHSMQKSHYVLFEVVEVVKGFGVYVTFNGVGSKVFLADVGFSTTAVPGAAMATRVHSPDENWFMTTGAALPVNNDIAEAIDHVIDDYVRKYGINPQGSELTALIMRTCIATGASNYIRYATPGENLDAYASSLTAAPIRSPGKIGRNDPCPCGSGKKFKKCCLK